jgi:hypothetical protein
MFVSLCARAFSTKLFPILRNDINGGSLSDGSSSSVVIYIYILKLYNVY